MTGQGRTATSSRAAGARAGGGLPRGTRRRALGLAFALVLLPALVAGATVGAKTIRGGKGGDRLNGGPKADRLLGGAGNDLLYGGRGRDRLSGQNGDDRLFGGSGRDRLYGGRGDDRLYGGRGNDLLNGGPGRDEFNARDGNRKGGQGNDRIMARDGEEDTINCGPGEDVAVVDAVEEGVFDCETVHEPPGTKPEEKERE